MVSGDGIDIEDRMLKRGREKAAARGVSIDWVLGDVRSFDIGRQFRVVLFPANALVHLLDMRSGGMFLVRKTASHG